MPMGGRLGQTLSRLGNIRLGAGPASAQQAGGTRPADRTLPFLGHLYDNRGNFKRMLDPMLTRPLLKQSLMGGFQPITLDMPLPVRLYADVVGADAPSSFYRCGENPNLADLTGLSPSLTPTALDKTASMSFGNVGGLTGGDGTTCLNNASAKPTSGYVFSPRALWDVSQPTAWTIEFLFYARTASDVNSPMFRHQGIADGSGNPNDVLTIFLDSSGNVQFFVHPALSGLSFTSATGFAPSLNAWHLLELVNTNGTYTLYIDGVLKYTSPGGTYQATFGQSFEACAHPGSMQELAIFKSSLSQAQATVRQNARSTGGYQASVLTDAPAGYWRFGDALGSQIAEPLASDIRMLLKSPQYSQAPLINDDKGVVVGSVGNGDGVGGFSHFSSSTARPITGTRFAIEAWIKPFTLTKDRVPQGGEAYIGGRCIAKLGPLASQGGFSMSQNGPDVLMGAPSAPITASNVLSAGRHQLIWVHDSTLGTPDTLYVDGVPVFTGNATGIAAPAAGLAIGNDPAVPSAFVAGFGGEIDEVTFWNFPPTAVQARAHFQAGTDMTQGDLVKLTEQDGDGTVVYTGIVEDIPDDYDLAPSFQIGLQPMVVELSDTAFSKNYQVPTDVAQMVQDAVLVTNHLTYTNQSIPMSGTLAQVDFTDSTCLQVLETAKKILGPSCWWFVDQNMMVWFQQIDTTLTSLYSVKRGMDYAARRYRSPIGALKNKVLCIGNIPPNQSVPIVSIYSDPASQSQYGVRYLHPPLVYPNIVDQPTLNLVAASVGSALNRRLTKVELDLPAWPLIQLGVNRGATMRYWEPNKNPLLEAEFGAGRYSPTYIVLDVECDGPFQKVVLAELPITNDDLKYEGDRIQQQLFLQQLLHPDLSTTVPGSMSGGFFSTNVGTPPTLPAGFTGWSLDAQNGLSLYLAGVLIARFGSQGGAGLLQSYGGYQPVDATHRAIDRFELPGNAVNLISKCYLSFSLKAFRATVQSVSGASSSSTTTSQNHSHHIFVGNVGTGNAATITNGPGSVLQTPLGSTPDSLVTNVDGSHSHDNPHTHTITAPDGLYDTGMAQGCHVFVDGVDRTTALGGPWGSGSAIDVSDLDISQWITTTGWHQVEVSSTSLGVIITQTTMKGYLISL